MCRWNIEDGGVQLTHGLAGRICYIHDLHCTQFTCGWAADDKTKKAESVRVGYCAEECNRAEKRSKLAFKSHCLCSRIRTGCLIAEEKKAKKISPFAAYFSQIGSVCREVPDDVVSTLEGVQSRPPRGPSNPFPLSSEKHARQRERTLASDHYRQWGVDSLHLDMRGCH